MNVLWGHNDLHHALSRLFLCTLIRLCPLHIFLDNDIHVPSEQELTAMILEDKGSWTCIIKPLCKPFPIYDIYIFSRLLGKPWHQLRMGSMQVCIREGGGLFHLVHAVADCIDEQGDHRGKKRLLPHVSIMNFFL